MMSFRDKTDADRALILARGYSEECFIGRHRPTRATLPSSDRRGYIVSYWKSPTNQRINIPDERCTTYGPPHLVVRDRGSEGWTVSDGSGRFAMTVDNREDAAALLDLARQHTTHCTIGYRSAPGTPIMLQDLRVDYWK